MGFESTAGIIKGYPNGKFKPLENMKKSEFISALVRMKGYNAIGKSKFSDVSGRWFEGYTAALEKLGYVKGMPNGLLGADSNITRAEVVTLINKVMGRTANKAKIDTLNVKSTFKDVAAGSWYYYDMIESTQSHRTSLFH